MIKDDSLEFQQECADFWSRRLKALHEEEKKQSQEQQKEKELADMSDEEYAAWLDEAVKTERKVSKIDMHKVMLSLMFNHPYPSSEEYSNEYKNNN